MVGERKIVRERGREIEGEIERRECGARESMREKE